MWSLLLNLGHEQLSEAVKRLAFTVILPEYLNISPEMFLFVKQDIDDDHYVC